MAALGHATYLVLDLLSLAGPLAYGFTRHSGFNRQWRSILPTLCMVAIPFVTWDALFTTRGIWGFHSEYHLGIVWLHLPLEEWLFFVCIPFACLFLHDVAGHIPSWHPGEFPARWLWGILGFACLMLAGLHLHRAYTVSAFGLAGLIGSSLAAGVLKGKTGQFTLTFAFHCLPFFVVNGFLTALPVVVYNNDQNLGLRMGTIPVEDLAYSFSLLAGNVLLFEWLKHRLADGKA